MIDPHRGRGRLAAILTIIAVLTGAAVWLLYLVGEAILTWQQVIS